MFYCICLIIKCSLGEQTLVFLNETSFKTLKMIQIIILTSNVIFMLFVLDLIVWCLKTSLKHVHKIVNLNYNAWKLKAKHFMWTEICNWSVCFAVSCIFHEIHYSGSLYRTHHVWLYRCVVMALVYSVRSVYVFEHVIYIVFETGLYSTVFLSPL